MGSKDIKKIAARIRALLAKTVENGCTEGEALAAAEKAAKIMAENDLTLDEIALREDGFEVKKAPAEDLVGQVLWKVANGVADLCQVRSWSDALGRNRTKVVFFGFATDVEVASYVLAIAERAMRDAVAGEDARNALFRASIRRRRVMTFADGMADRLCEKIREIAWVRRREAGKGIILAKEEMIDQELAARGYVERSRRDRYSQRGMGGYEDGRKAAEAIAFEAGVGTSAKASGVLSAPAKD